VNGIFTDDDISERTASELVEALETNEADGSRPNGDELERLKTECPLCRPDDADRGAKLADEGGRFGFELVESKVGS
jgi:hypothetical protein